MFLGLFILGFAVSIGVTLLARGWRGARIDDHPICRKCGFDLFGLPAGAARCSECGADLTNPRATRRGHRARRPGLMAFGAFILLVCASVCGAYGWGALRDIDPNPWKPLSWLLSETSPTGPATARSAAFAELMRRLKANKLDADKVNAMCDVGLAHQSDIATPFLSDWGDIIQEAHALKLLSDDRWQRYARQAGEFHLHVRPRVRRGDPLPLRVNHTVARAGSNRASGYLWQNVRVTSLRVGDRTIELAGPATSPRVHLSHNVVEHLGQLDDATLQVLRDGKHSVRATLAVNAFFGSPSSTFEAPIVLPPVEIEATCELLPAGVQTVKLAAPGPDAAPPGVTVLYAGYHPSGDLVLRLDVRPSDHALAHTVYARVGDRLTRLGAVVSREFVWTTELFGAPLPDFIQDRIDLVMRPTPELAHRTTDVFEILKDDVVLRDVKIARPPARDDDGDNFGDNNARGEELKR